MIGSGARQVEAYRVEAGSWVRNEMLALSERGWAKDNLRFGSFFSKEVVNAD